MSYWSSNHLGAHHASSLTDLSRIDESAVFSTSTSYWRPWREEAAGDPRKNNPGSAELLVKLGGVHSGSTGVPFIFVIDPQGKIIATSERPVPGQKIGDNIGYPTEPEEIEWFMKMVKDGAPLLSEDDARSIEDWLRRNTES